MALGINERIDAERADNPASGPSGMEIKPTAALVTSNIPSVQLTAAPKLVAMPSLIAQPVYARCS